MMDNYNARSTALWVEFFVSRRQFIATPPVRPSHLPAPIIPSRRRTIWSKKWLLRRPYHGNYDALLQELHREDRKGYKNFMRISAELFNEMVESRSPIAT